MNQEISGARSILHPIQPVDMLCKLGAAAVHFTARTRTSSPCLLWHFYNYVKPCFSSPPYHELNCRHLIIESLS
uniref:Uncharacterized protein n=1 Tax=Triticum urartu TaxID=4572 RepID=A0A8R7U6B3_TRIUA